MYCRAGVNSVFSIHLMYCNGDHDSLVNDAFEYEVGPCAGQCCRPSDIGCVRDTEAEGLAELIMTRPVVAPSRGRRLQFVWVPAGGERSVIISLYTISLYKLYGRHQMH